MSARTATLTEQVGQFGRSSTLNIKASYGPHHPYDFKLEPRHPERRGTIEVRKNQIEEAYY